MNEKMFIWTQSKSSAAELRNLGFEEIETRDLSTYVFLNDTENELPSDFDKKTLYYSNKLCI